MGIISELRDIISPGVILLGSLSLLLFAFNLWSNRKVSKKLSLLDNSLSVVNGLESLDLFMLAENTYETADERLQELLRIQKMNQEEYDKMCRERTALYTRNEDLLKEITDLQSLPESADKSERKEASRKLKQLKPEQEQVKVDLKLMDDDLTRRSAAIQRHDLRVQCFNNFKSMIEKGVLTTEV